MAFFSAATANTISAIRVGLLMRMRFVVIPTNTFTRQLLQQLMTCGVIIAYSRVNITGSNSNKYKVVLAYKDGYPVASSLRLISKPSSSIYIKYNQLVKFMSTRRGILILSTSRGLLTDSEALRLHIGGLAVV